MRRGLGRVHACRRKRGFSLVELLVSLAIGLFVTLAISSVLLRNEGTKRSTTSINDINQASVYATYVMDRVIRSAGSGYSQNWPQAFGCTLSAQKANATILPRPTAWTTFPSLQRSFVVAPVMIEKSAANVGSGSSAVIRGDLITVMAGTGGFSESPQPVQSIVTASPTINLQNSVGYRAGDLVLLADSAVTQGCQLQELGTPSTSGSLPLTGDYLNANTSPVGLASFSSTSYLAQLGNVLTNNPPQFLTFGVWNNNVLASDDMLNVTGTGTPSEIAEGVVEMRALYGVDNSPSPKTGTVTSWVDPVVGSGYESTLLVNPATPIATVQATLRKIVAIRIGLILRTNLSEKTPINQPTTITLFRDLPTGLQQTRNLQTSDMNYRFRTVEVTIPLRNVLLAPSP